MRKWVPPLARPTWSSRRMRGPAMNIQMNTRLSIVALTAFVLSGAAGADDLLDPLRKIKLPQPCIVRQVEELPFSPKLRREAILDIPFTSIVVNHYISEASWEARKPDRSVAVVRDAFGFRGRESWISKDENPLTEILLREITENLATEDFIHRYAAFAKKVEMGGITNFTPAGLELLKASRTVLSETKPGKEVKFSLYDQE